MLKFKKMMMYEDVDVKKLKYNMIKVEEIIINIIILFYFCFPSFFKTYFRLWPRKWPIWSIHQYKYYLYPILGFLSMLFIELYLFLHQHLILKNDPAGLFFLVMEKPLYKLKHAISILFPIPIKYLSIFLNQ